MKKAFGDVLTILGEAEHRHEEGRARHSGAEGDGGDEAERLALMSTPGTRSVSISTLFLIAFEMGQLASPVLASSCELGTVQTRDPALDGELHLRDLPSGTDLVEGADRVHVEPGRRGLVAASVAESAMA